MLVVLKGFQSQEDHIQLCLFPVPINRQERLSPHCYHKEFQGLTLSNLTPSAWESGISSGKRQEVGNPGSYSPRA